MKAGGLAAASDRFTNIRHFWEWLTAHKAPCRKPFAEREIAITQTALRTAEISHGFLPDDHAAFFSRHVFQVVTAPGTQLPGGRHFLTEPRRLSSKGLYRRCLFDSYASEMPTIATTADPHWREPLRAGYCVLVIGGERSKSLSAASSPERFTPRRANDPVRDGSLFGRSMISRFLVRQYAYPRPSNSETPAGGDPFVESDRSIIRPIKRHFLRRPASRRCLRELAMAP